MTKKQRSIVDLVKFGAVVIAFAILIFYIIIPIVTKSRKKAFVEEIDKYIQKAEDNYVADYYVDETIDSDEVCFDIKDIIKGINSSYKGVVVIKNDNTDIKEYIYISNGHYVYNSHESYKAIKVDDLLDSNYAKPYYLNCNNYKNGKIY